MQPPPASPPPEHHRTAPEDRIPLVGKLGYASGGMAVNLMANGVVTLASFVLNIKLGMDPALVGLLMAIPRFYDAITTPVVGVVSDNWHGRWGRRKPFMVLGALGAGIFFAALWWLPPGQGQMHHFWYFLAVSLVFFTFVDLFTVPWGAMGLAMTADYHERTRLMTVNTLLSSVVLVGLAWVYALTQLPVFSDSLAGTKVVTAGVGALMTALALGSVLLCKEKNLATARKEGARPIKAQLASVMTNRPFLILSTVVLLMCLGIFSIMSLSGYVGIYYVFGGDEKAASVLLGWNGTAWQVSSFLLVGIVGLAAVRWGKRHTLVVALLCTMAGNLLKWPCANPHHPWLFLVPPVLIATGFCALWTLTAAMLADVCDYEELRTGERNEGTLNAMYWWINKLGVTAAFVLSGVLLNLTGFSAALGGGQSGNTIFLMRLFDAGIPALAVAGAILLTLLYPISEARSYEIRAELEKRRGRLGST